MFDEDKALKLLKEDRRKYLKDTVSFVQGYLDRHLDDLASITIRAAAENLLLLDGSLQYVEQLKNFKTDSYPRFGRIFDV